MPDTTKITAGPKPCAPFVLQVMIYSPETGYKFQVSVERACSPANDVTWKLLFDLYKRPSPDKDFDQLAAISYTATTPATQAGVQGMLDGVTAAQSDALTKQVYPAAKTAIAPNATPADKAALHDSLAQAVVALDV